MVVVVSSSSSSNDRVVLMVMVMFGFGFMLVVMVSEWLPPWLWATVKPLNWPQLRASIPKTPKIKYPLDLFRTWKHISGVDLI